MTTYPAILTLRQQLPPQDSQLNFLKVHDALPEDLSARFASTAIEMPQKRLSEASWKLENDSIAAVRRKIYEGGPSLREVYGEPLYGIKTGLNDAFVVDLPTRDKLIKEDSRSAQLLVPFLRGENIRRWRVESSDLFLINIPKGKIAIESYGAIRDHLLAYKNRLEDRATQQEWFELQQAQLAYQDALHAPKVIWPQILDKASFCYDDKGFFLINKAYFFPCDDIALAGYLNSRLIWFCFLPISVRKAGGYREATAQHIAPLPAPRFSVEDWEQMRTFSSLCTANASSQWETRRLVMHRILDLRLPGTKVGLGSKLKQWWKLDFADFLVEIKRAFRREIPVRERDEWERYLVENRKRDLSFSVTIESTERAIDNLVYRSFHLNREEVSLLEAEIREPK